MGEVVEIGEVWFRSAPLLTDCIGTTMLRFCEMWTVCSNLLRPTSRSSQPKIIHFATRFDDSSQFVLG
jgi:hypothetical protein